MSEGWVKLVDHFTRPGDLSIVNCARQSYGRASQEFGPKDLSVLTMMMELKHGTPFEGYVFVFQIRCSIKEARDWFRYRFSSYSEYSTRFSKRIEDEYVPEGDAIRGQRMIEGKRIIFPIESITAQSMIQDEFRKAYENAENSYKNILTLGGAQEMASYVYPLGQMTEFTWIVNARSLMNFLSQRMDDAALLELRRKAYTVHSLAEPLIPRTLDLWAKHRQPDMFTDFSDDDMMIPEELR